MGPKIPPNHSKCPPNYLQKKAFLKKKVRAILNT